MRFNLVVNMERMSDDMDMRDVLRHVTEMAQMADEGGFDIVWAATTGRGRRRWSLGRWGAPSMSGRKAILTISTRTTTGTR